VVSSETSLALYLLPNNSVIRNKKEILSAPSPKLCTSGSNNHLSRFRNIFWRASSFAITNSSLSSLSSDLSLDWEICVNVAPASAAPALGVSRLNASRCRAYGTANSGISIILSLFSKFFSASRPRARHWAKVDSHVRLRVEIHCSAAFFVLVERRPTFAASPLAAECPWPCSESAQRTINETNRRLGANDPLAIPPCRYFPCPVSIMDNSSIADSRTERSSSKKALLSTCHIPGFK